MVINASTVIFWVEQFVLILFRMAAIFTLSPVFGKKNAPIMLKIIFSLFCSYVLIGLFPPDFNRVYTIQSFINACINELLVGLTIGFITVLFFTIAFSAGQIIDINIGFSMAQLFDPQMGTQVSLTGSMLNIFMLLSFFTTNGHHMLIKILSETFTMLPPGNFSLSTDIFYVILDVFALTIVMGLKIAMPIVAATFIIEIALGIVIRAVPQMNMFVIGIPVKIIAGLIILFLIAPLFEGITGNVFNEMYKSIDTAFKEMVI